MKKIVLILSMLLMTFSAVINISADYITMPDDDFFKDHGDEISAWGLWHQAQKDIAVVAYPGSDEILGVIEEGRVIRVLHLYEDSQGVLWGAQSTDDQGLWFKMKHLPEYYANFNFWNDHQDEFKKTYYVPIYFEEDAWLIVWEYPGSDRISGTLPTSVTRDKRYPLYEGAEYTDEHGIRWTSISHMGVSGWLNMEAMLSDTEPEVQSIWISIDENFDPSQYDFSESFLELYGKELLIGGLVIGVCALTGILAVKRKTQD